MDAGFIYASSGNYFVADFVDKQDIIVNVVPEPTTALLLGFGLLGLCAAGRKRIKRLSELIIVDFAKTETLLLSSLLRLVDPLCLCGFKFQYR